MSALLALARLRVQDVTRNRGVLTLFMGLPVVLLLLLALVFWNGHPFERKTVLWVAEADAAAPVLSALAAYPELRAEPARSLPAALGKLRARMANAVLHRDAAGWSLLVAQSDQVLGRGLMQVLPVPARLSFVAAPRLGYVHFLFPGLLSSTIMLAGLYAMGSAMLRYRQSLFLKKLATTPLRRSTFVAAQILGRSLLVLLQIAVLSAAAVLLLGVPLSLAAALGVIVLTLLGLIVFCGAGFALACAIHTEDLMLDVIGALTLPLILLSGIFFPPEVFPAPLAALSKVLPSAMLVDAMRAVVLYGETQVAALAKDLLGLMAWGALTFGMSRVLFRWHG